MSQVEAIITQAEQLPLKEQALLIEKLTEMFFDNEKKQLENDNEKPRLEGITSIIDKLQPLNIENFKNIVSYVDSVKIPQSCFLLYSPTELERRIKFYHEHNISVAIDSKITDYALSKMEIFFMYYLK